MTKYLGSLITKDESQVLLSNNYEDTSANGVWNLTEQLMFNNQSNWPTAGVDNPAKFVENIFSTYTYTGTGSSQTITNGIDLSSEGGLVIIKARSASGASLVFDTVRGAKKKLEINTGAEVSRGSGEALDSFNSNGFTLSGDSANDNLNLSGTEYVAWTFRKAPKFFDVVTYEGTGSARTVSHSLGAVPGMIIIKNRDQADNWAVYHRASDGSAPEDKYLIFNTTAAGADSADWWNDTAPTSSVFTVGTDHAVNASSENYVAYIFGHDTTSDGMIRCGTYTQSDSGVEIDLDWEPQWLIKKRVDSTASWYIMDTLRGFIVTDNPVTLKAESADAEGGLAKYRITNTGFNWNSDSGDAGTYVYTAIRKGLMATPTSRASVFDLELGGSSVDDNALTINTGFPIDLTMFTDNYASGGSNYIKDRLRGNQVLSTETTSAQAGGSTYQSLDSSEGLINRAGSSGGNLSGGIYYAWRRAPKFFDIVAYDGNNSSGRSITHNLGVAPEMIWVKNREYSGGEDWVIYHKSMNGGTDPEDYVMYLNRNNAQSNVDDWYDFAPTSTIFKVSADRRVNGTGGDGNTYIAYLFATLAGISKVGGFSHTNGSSTDVDCGFSSGSSLVIVKRRDSSGDWYHWDSVRGIVSGNDPYLLLNTNAAHTTNTDYIDPLDSGFQIASGFTTGDYIFYAIAA